MKPNIAVTILLILAFNNAFAAKRSLIVAIGNYDRANTGWHTISSLNDIPLIDSILSKHGFTDRVTLQDEEATRDGIMAALKKLAKRTKAGDIVLVHFSAHGQLIEDENGGNKEEAIVAWGAPASGVPGYKGEKHLLYSDIKAMRDSLRLHAGPAGDVIFFFDACHSGGLTRGRAITRGGAAPVQISGWQLPDSGSNKADGYLPDNTGMAPYVAISACRSGELNSEYPDGHCGSLSYILSKAFSKIDAADETYSQLFASLLNDMYDINPTQHPVISGNADRMIFAGQAVVIDPHFVIKEQKDNGAFLLNGGAVNGLTKGSRLEAYPSGVRSRKDNTPLFTATVTDDPDMLSSEIKTDTALPDLKYTSYWFYIRQVAYHGGAVRLDADSLSAFPKLKRALDEFFSADTEILLTAQAPQLMLGYNKELNTYNIYNSLSGAFIHDLPADNDALKTYLIAYAQCTALKKINMANGSLSFSLDIRGNDGAQMKTKKDGMMVVKDGDEVNITLANKHDKLLYINIFNFNPDGTFELIQSDIKLASYLSIQAKAGKPYGTDMILAIATEEPLYLHTLSASSITRGAAGRGALNSLQKIFSSPTRGQMAPEDEEGYTANLSFEIEP
jgi:hypothetical protein